jgi:hypothetical protein
MKVISISFLVHLLSIAKATFGVTISQSYLESHLLFFLVLLQQEMSNEPTLPQAKFCPDHAKVFFCQRSVLSSFSKEVTDSKSGDQHAYREKVAKKPFRREKKESAGFFYYLDRLCEWISFEDDFDSDEDIEEAT